VRDAAADPTERGPESGRDRTQDASAPHARSPEQRPCQVAWWVHRKGAMCSCKVCVSERLFLRILALIVP